MVQNVIRKFPFWVRVPELRYYASAQALITFYLGRHVLGDQNDDFLRFDGARLQGTNWQYLARVIHLAALLFALRLEPGFDEICRRLKTRELEQAHSELSLAAMFKAHGFKICARPEALKTGEDFDFSILGDDIDANVEVWATNQTVFNPDALRRRLGDKRKQLPAGKPAILACLFPESWFDQVDRLYDHFDSLAERFFKSTSRINIVLFAHEEFSHRNSTAGTLLLNGYAVPHSNPRHQSKTLQDAMMEGPTTHASVSRFVDQPKGRGLVQTQDEFHRWVNWLIDG